MLLYQLKPFQSNSKRKMNEHFSTVEQLNCLTSKKQTSKFCRTMFFFLENVTFLVVEFLMEHYTIVPK